MTADLSLRIKSSRAALGWSQTKLAEVAGLPKAQLSRYESGRSVPRPEAIGKIATALNVSYDWLTTGSDGPESDENVQHLPGGLVRVNVELQPATVEKLRAYAEQRGMSMESAFLDILDRQMIGAPADNVEGNAMRKDALARARKRAPATKKPVKPKP